MKTRALAALMLLSLASPALAASTLEELLAEVRDARSAEDQASREREKDFLAKHDQQAKLLAQALARSAAARARSEALSRQYDANDRELNALNQLLSQRAGDLGELFGVTRQVAGDVGTVLSQSLIGVHYPGREDFLRKMAAAKSLPSIGELERLWLEMTRELTQSGSVIRFDTTIAAADGSTRQAEVVRIGPFTAMSEGEYLLYRPGLKQLAVLPRQPSGALVDAARAVQAAQGGYVMAGVDPSRGVLLALSVERPTLLERIERGEVVGYVIITVGAIAALLALYQLVFLLRTRVAVRRQLAALDRPSADNPVGRVLLAFRGDASRIEDEADAAEVRLSEAVLREVPALERFQSFLRLTVAAGPLLGLIGTVIGMIITFQSITESGSSDPKLMAAGIGQAMIATVLGLGIAIPLLFVNAGLAMMSRHMVQILDEQSAGLLAESIEQRKRA